MFGILKREGIKCLDFFINKPVMWFGKCVYKKGKKIWIGRSTGYKYDYCTKFEEKDKEWRFVVFRGKVLRAMEKVPNIDTEIWKQKNCDFRHVNERFLDSEVRYECLEACKDLGIDLAGVDVLVNTSGEVKVIEVNSGMAMGSRTAGRLFRRIESEEGLR